MSVRSRSDSEQSSDNESNVFLELGSDPSTKHFELDEEASSPLLRVFSFRNLEGTHETLGLADIMTMIRGDPDEYLPKVNCIYLGIFDAKTKRIGAIGKSVSKQRDPRVMGISEWTGKIPLPLGGNLYSLLRLVFHLHEAIPDTTFKLCADVVPVPRQFLEGPNQQSPRMKRFLNWGQDEPSILRLHGGNVMALENPKNALDPNLSTLQEHIIVCQDSQPTQMKPPTVWSPPEQVYGWSEVVKKFN
jgi:hypothetical protein